MNALAILNLIVSVLILVLLGKQYLSRERGTRESFEPVGKPIHHPKVEGPTTAKITSAIGYWRPKEDPKAEPFLAAWYEKDTTGAREASSSWDTDFVPIPSDTYVDLMGRRITGPKFRALYEPSEAVMEVSKFKPKNPLRSTNLVTAKPTAAITPEEEQRLAEEYELGGGHVADRT